MGGNVLRIYRQGESFWVKIGIGIKSFCPSDGSDTGGVLVRQEYLLHKRIWYICKYERSCLIRRRMSTRNIGPETRGITAPKKGGLFGWSIYMEKGTSRIYLRLFSSQFIG